MGISDWHLKDEDGMIDSRLMPLTRMWEPDDFLKMWTREDREVVPFDFADKVLCLLGLFNLWWGPLSEIYYSVILEDRKNFRTVPKDHRRCKAAGCTNIFPRKRANRFEKEFCSTQCQKNHWLREQRNSPTMKAKRMDKCPKGHDRSPENVYQPPGNRSIQCRVCNRESKAALRERRALAA